MAPPALPALPRWMTEPTVTPTLESVRQRVPRTPPAPQPRRPKGRPKKPVAPPISEAVREEARVAAFGADNGWNGWADAGPAGQREDGKFYNRLGLKSTQSHRHVAKAWQESGCITLRAFRDQQAEKAKAKWDRNDLSLADLQVEQGRFTIPRVDLPISPTPKAIYQLAEMVGAKPAQVMALYDCEWDTLARRERGEEIPVPGQMQERIALGDEILNKHLAWLPDPVRHKPRLYRFRNRDDQEVECRAVLSHRYGIIDHAQILDILWEAVPEQGREETLISYVEDDGNKMQFSLLFPDYVKKAPDSEYGVALRVQDSEEGSWAAEFDPWLFRAICWNGCRWGVRQKKGNALRKIHLGLIDKAALIAQTRQAIQIGLSEGLEVFRLTQLNREVKVSQPEQLLAYTAAQAKITRQQGQVLAEAFRREPEARGSGIVNAWTRGGQNYTGDTRTLFERTGASLLAPTLQANEAAVKRHWQELESLSKRYAEKHEEAVERFATVLAA